MPPHTQAECPDVYTEADLEFLPDAPGLQTPWENRVRCTVCGREWYQTD